MLPFFSGSNFALVSHDKKRGLFLGILHDKRVQRVAVFGCNLHRHPADAVLTFVADQWCFPCKTYHQNISECTYSLLAWGRIAGLLGVPRQANCIKVIGHLGTLPPIAGPLDALLSLPEWFGKAELYRGQHFP